MRAEARRSGGGVWRYLRSAGAVLAGLVTIVVLSIATDQVIHALGVYPPWGEPMLDPGLNMLALAYRVVWTLTGGYVTARLAPTAPIAHALALGVVGLVLGGLGAVAAWEMSPAWFLVLVAVFGPPCAWAGGRLERALHGPRPIRLGSTPR